MTLWLKQSTAKVVSFGPFLDKTDGVTEETGLVSALDHATTGIKLSKNGGALTIRHASVTATTYDAYGMYLVTLDTTDTNTLGTLRMAFNEAATCLPVWQDFMVLPANVYDSLVLGTDALDVSAIQFAGQTITASGGVTIPAATLASTTNITAGTITTVTNLTNAPTNGDLTATMKTSVTTAATAATPIAASVAGAVGSVTAAVTLPTIPTNWITADGIATDAFGALELAAGAASEIAAAISIPSAATIASQVRTELTTELAHITLAKKILKNRTETDPATGVMTVYDDDGTTPLYTANIYTDVAGATAYDGTAGVNRRNALA